MGKHKINEAPKLSSDDKEEMLSNYKTLKCSKCSHKIIIKNKKSKNKSLVKIKKNEVYCKGESGDIVGSTEIVGSTLQVTDSIDSTEESGDIIGSETNLVDETDSIDSKESGDIFDSETNMVGSTDYHQETIHVNDGIDEEVRCTNLLNHDTSPTWQEKESIKEERAIEESNRG